MLKLISFFGDLIFPRRCALCDRILGAKEEGTCAGCARITEQAPAGICMMCGEVASPEKGLCRKCADRSGLDVCFAPFEYKDDIRRSLLRFKYGGRAEYAAFYAGRMLEKCREIIRSCAPDVIVPVPIHGERLRERGYNQAELLAKETGKMTGIKVTGKMVKREKNTKAQSLLSYEERRKNLQGAFRYTGKVVVPRSVLIIDDIFTTGATAGSLAALLKQNGAEKVSAICVARTSGSR